MYTVEFYKDVNDHCEIGEYFAELAEKAKTDKNARINMNKIAEYILLLKRNGTRIGILQSDQSEKTSGNCDH